MLLTAYPYTTTSAIEIIQLVNMNVIMTNELHKPLQRLFDKHTVFTKEVDDIWTVDLVDMSPFSRLNNSYKYLLTVINVLSKYGLIVPLKTKTGKDWRFGNYSSMVILPICGQIRALNSTTDS